MNKIKNMLIAVSIMLFSCNMVMATALTAERLTPTVAGKHLNLTAETNQTIYAGSMVSVNSSGYAIPASDTASTTVIGKALETVTTTTTRKTIEIGLGVFRWENEGDAFDDSNINDFCYVIDDQSVSNASANSIIAGIVFDVDSSGVWVDTRDMFRTAGALTTLSVSGASTLSGAVIAVSSIDAANLTTDAGAGLDAQAAGTLVLGAATATKVEIADTGVETEIQGTLDIQEAATFTVAPILTLTNTISTGNSPALTNSPSANLQPNWFKIQAAGDTNVYVVPGWAL